MAPLATNSAPGWCFSGGEFHALVHSFGGYYVARTARSLGDREVGLNRAVARCQDRAQMSGRAFRRAP
jgi:hypothetical protein